MEDLRKRLSWRIHSRDISLINHKCLTDIFLMDGLYRLAYDADSRVAGNALWCMTWYDREQSEWLVPKRKELIKLAITTVNATVRRLTLCLLEKMSWAQEDIQTDFLDFCLDKISSATETPGVRTLCIKLCYLQCRHYPELLKELEIVLNEVGQYPMNPAISSIRKSILRKINRQLQ